MKTRSFGFSVIGLKRDKNEDTYVTNKGLGVYLVCDGMGGHAAGEVASSMAARAVMGYLKSHEPAIRSAGKKPGGFFALTHLLSDAVNYACQVIYEKACSDNNLAGMGTTLTMLLIVDNQAVMAHVGDSRLYLYRQGALHHLSNDHTLFNQMLSNPDSDTLDQGASNALTRVVGYQPGVLVDTLLFELRPGDRCLLCTDGLSNCFRDDAQAAGLISGKVDKLPERLLQHALDRGGNDNITAVIIEMETHQVSDDAAEAEEQLDLIADVPLFSQLSLARHLAITEIADIREYLAGTPVLKKGQVCDGLHLVIDGLLKLTNGNDSRILSRGSVFGEASLVRSKKSPVEIVATQDSQALVISRQEFERLLIRRPKLGRRLLKRLVSMIAGNDSI